MSPEREEKNKMEIEAGKLDLREAISTMAGPQAEAMFIGEIDKETNEAALLDMNTIVMCCRVAAAPGISIEQVPTRIMESTIVNALSA